MRGLLCLLATEFKLFFRIPVFAILTIIFPAGLLYMFGAIFGNKPVDMFGGYGTIDVSIPSYSGMIIVITGILSLPIGVANYREKKILKRFNATPMNAYSILVSQVFVNFIMTLCGMIVLIIVGKIFFDMRFLGRVFPVIFAFTLSTLSIFSCGFLIASVSPPSVRATNSIAMAVYFPMLFLTGATMPIEMFPPVMKTISKFIPATYAINLQKGIWLGGTLPEFSHDILMLSIFLVACIVISVLTFRWE